MNMINGLQKRGCHIQERRFKTIGQDIQVETYKERNKIPLWTIQIIHSNFKVQMSQISNSNNNYTTAPTSSNPYITRKLNNIDKAKMIKAERNDWTRTYHKTLKRLEAMIDMQRQVKNIMKIAVETNTIITEIEDTILKTSINNQVTNMTNIIGVSENLRHLIQSDIENRVFQIQQMLADKLNTYKGRGNVYMDNNIQEIQKLFKEEKIRKED